MVRLITGAPAWDADGCILNHFPEPPSAEEIAQKFPTPLVMATPMRDEGYRLDWSELVAASPDPNLTRVLLAGEDFYTLPGPLVIKIARALGDTTHVDLLGSGLMVSEKGFTDLHSFRGLTPGRAVAVYESALHQPARDWDWSDW